jgi:hypothetical protein
MGQTKHSLIVTGPQKFNPLNTVINILRSYNCFNIKNLCMLSEKYVSMFHMILTITVLMDWSLNWR